MPVLFQLELLSLAHTHHSTLTPTVELRVFVTLLQENVWLEKDDSVSLTHVPVLFVPKM